MPRLRRTMIHCAECSAEFEAIVSPSGLVTRKYCSRACLHKGSAGSKNSRFKQPDTIACEECGNKFEAKKRWERKKRFCSPSCCTLFRRRNGFPRSQAEGSKWKDPEGYIFVKVGGQWIPEHRLVAEAKLGRGLKRSEVVHHRNGNKSDNRPENLEVVTRSRHMEIHAEAEAIGLAVMSYEPEIYGLGC